MYRNTIAAFTAVLLALPAAVASVKVSFDPRTSQVGPFPTDFLTTPDPAQKTGLRVNLPQSDCGNDTATCAQFSMLNPLDGFSLFPRLRIRFDGPIDPNTLRNGVFVLWLDQINGEEYGIYPPGHLTPINQVLWDPSTNTAFAKPDEVLGQTRHYALLVTDAVRDPAGASIGTTDGFTACLAMTIGGDYCRLLSDAIQSYQAVVAPAHVVGGSLFTTTSATAWMESARQALQSTDAGLALAAPRSTFDVSTLATLTLHLQTGHDPDTFADTPLPVGALQGVGRIAFGSFQSPLVLDQTLTIPATPTGEAVTLPATSEPVYFEAFLPASPEPSTGYPVVMVGHPMPNNRFGLPLAMAATLASQGFATIAINMFGSGQGPKGTVVITDKNGAVNEVPFGGRAVDVNGDGTFDPLQEGCLAASFLRDCARQNAVDHLQLVRAIQSGIDVNGDGLPDLDASQIYYAGVSIGGMTGTIIHSVEPAIRSAVLNGAPGPDTMYWVKSLRPMMIQVLAATAPNLLNKGNDYDADYVARDQPAKTITVAGAVPLQEYFERQEWIQQAGAPWAWSPHLWQSPLPGVGMKRTMFQFAEGDLSVPAGSSAMVARAANMQVMTSIYRHDLAVGIFPDLAQVDPHYFLLPMGSPAEIAVAMAGQTQVAEFLASQAWVLPDVNPLVFPMFGINLFESPPEVLPIQ